MKNPKLHNTKRLSLCNRPDIGEVCIFNPAVHLIDNIYANGNRTLLKPYMTQMSKCTVIKHGDYTEYVQFNNTSDTDIVSPEFLLRRKLTAFGKTLQNAYKLKVSPL